jgi:hypothetical protein
MSQPTPLMSKWLRANLQSYLSSTSPSVACVLQQLSSCTSSEQPGWCYQPTATCQQAIVFEQHPSVPLFLLCPVVTTEETD